MKNEKNTFLIIFMIILLIITGVLLYFTFKSKEKITITFNTDSEQKIDSVEIYSGDSIALPILEKKDYDFDGWYIGEVKIDNSYKYKNSTTINARWKKKNYILSFDTDGGNYIESISVKCGLIILPATPEKKGYTFLEWHDINGNKVDNNSNLDCVNQTIKATWEKDKENYTVTFDTDGGTSINVQTVNVGEKVIKPANPTKSGYTFKEWQLNGNTFDFDSVVNTDMTLKAIWVKNGESIIYTATFDTDGGTKINSQIIKSGEKVVKPANPTKSGYTFKEWQLNGKKYNFDTIMNSNITLKAVWEKVASNTSYTITFSQGNIKSKTIKCNEKITNLPKLSSTKGMYFIGWFDNDKQYKDGDIMPCKNLTLLAKYYSISERKLVTK